MEKYTTTKRNDPYDTSSLQVFALMVREQQQTHVRPRGRRETERPTSVVKGVKKLLPDQRRDKLWPKEFVSAFVRPGRNIRPTH